MKNIINGYYKGLALMNSYNLSPYKLSCLFIFSSLIISLFITGDVYAGNTSSGALDEAYDATKGWIGDVFRFLGITSIVVTLISILVKFNALVLLSCLAVGLISMFGISVMEEMTGAII